MVSGEAGASAGAGAMGKTQSANAAQFASRFLVVLLVAIALVSAHASAGVAFAQASNSEWQPRTGSAYSYKFDPLLATPTSNFSPDAFVDRYGPAFDDAAKELSLVFKLGAPPETVVWVYAPETMDLFYPAKPGEAAVPVRSTVPPGAVVVDADALAQLTEIEATNAIREAVAREYLAQASNGRLGSGFVEGMARYAQRPVTSVISRYAAAVQNAKTQNSLLTWDDLSSGRTDPASDLASAESYAMVAYLMQKYGIATFQDFLSASRTAPTWKVALESAYKVKPVDLERQWRDNLSRWANGDWKTNVIAAFDLDPARALLERGNYQAAKNRLDASVLLFSQLGDEESLAAAQALAGQCNIGLQAEALMTQTEQALAHYAYPQANDLLSQAEVQYGQLPPEQRPTKTIEQYRNLTNIGLSATAELANAHRLANSWTDYPDARASAIKAGQQFSALGDADHVAESRDVLADIDRRQRRLVYLLGGFALISGAWLLLWRRTSTAKRLHWPRQLPETSAPSERAK